MTEARPHSLSRPSRSSSSSSDTWSTTSASASVRPKPKGTSPIPLGAWRFKPGIQPEYKDGLWMVIRNPWMASDVTFQRKEEHREDAVYLWRAKNLIPGQWFIASIIPLEMFEKSGALSAESGHQIAEWTADGKVKSLLSKDRFEIVKDPAIVKLVLGPDTQTSGQKKEEKGPSVILEVYALKDWVPCKGRYIQQPQKPEPEVGRRRRSSSTMRASQTPFGWVSGLFTQKK